MATSANTVALTCAEHAKALLLPTDGTDPVLYLLRPDGKITWCGTLAASRQHDHDTDPLRIAIAALRAPSTKMGAPPILGVDQALPSHLCAALVARCRDGTDRIQGRVGLSNPSLDPTRKRRSHINLDSTLAAQIDECLIYSLLPMVERCFDYRVTRRKGYKVSLYDAADSGFFHPHRDNADRGTRYRRFALSLALNDDWEGGGLAFPEFGPHCHRIGAGNALVFPVSLIHQVQPIQRGQRFMLLTFFYDEAGALDRRACMTDPSVLETKYPDAIDPRLLADYARYHSPESRFAPGYDTVPEASDDAAEKKGTEVLFG